MSEFIFGFLSLFIFIYRFLYLFIPMITNAISLKNYSNAFKSLTLLV